MSDAALAAVLRRDRAIVAACLVVLILLAWAYVVWLADAMEMGGMDLTGFRMIPAGSGLMMPADAPWHAIEFAFVFAMWTVMMVGMMTPSVTPLVLLYVRVGRQAAAQQQPLAASAFLAGGYLLAWIAFSLIATLGQWAVERMGLLTPSMASASSTFGGLGRCGAVSMDPAQGCLPPTMPVSAAIHSAAWWFSRRCDRLACVSTARSSAESVTPRISRDGTLAWRHARAQPAPSQATASAAVAERSSHGPCRVHDIFVAAGDQVEMQGKSLCLMIL
jgi:hypothetical protein